MAISKGFKFSFDEQSAANFGMAYAHPARVVIMKRLLAAQSLTFLEMVDGVPLSRSTMNQHVEILKRLQMIEPVLLENNLAGYRLNLAVYRQGAYATRDQFRTATTVPLKRYFEERG